MAESQARAMAFVRSVENPGATLRAETQPAEAECASRNYYLTAPGKSASEYYGVYTSPYRGRRKVCRPKQICGARSKGTGENYGVYTPRLASVQAIVIFWSPAARARVNITACTLRRIGASGECASHIYYLAALGKSPSEYYGVHTSPYRGRRKVCTPQLLPGNPGEDDE